MDILQTGVFDKGISDHAAITAVTHIKRLPKDDFVKTREVHKTWFDVDSAVRELNDGKESINDMSFDQLVEGTVGKIKKTPVHSPQKEEDSKAMVQSIFSRGKGTHVPDEENRKSPTVPTSQNLFSLFLQTSSTVIQN